MAGNPTSTASDSSTSNILNEFSSLSELNEHEKENLSLLDEETQAAIQKLKIKKQKLLLSDNGIFALQEKLITPKQAKKIIYRISAFLFTPNGLLILKEKTIDLKLLCQLSDSLRSSKHAVNKTTTDVNKREFIKFATEKGMSPELQSYLLRPEDEASWDDEIVSDDDLDKDALATSDLLENSKVFQENCVKILAQVLYAFAHALDINKIIEWPNKFDLGQLLLPYQKPILDFLKPQKVSNLDLKKLTALMTCNGMAAFKNNLNEPILQKKTCDAECKRLMDKLKALSTTTTQENSSATSARFSHK